VSFKTFDLANDVAPLQSSINEVIAISSSIYAGDTNVKFFQNIASASQALDLGGYFQTVFDASPTSSLSTALLDLTYGYSTGSTYNVAATSTASQNEKIKMYRYFAGVLLGDSDSVFNINSADQEECFFVFLKRGTMKDEIKKGATSLVFRRASTYITGADTSAVTNYKGNYIGGDYAPLKNGADEVGQVWYQAGVIVLSSALVWNASLNWSGSKTLVELQYSGTINQLIDGFRTHVERIDLHNQTNLYSTVYFCHARNAEFNYSSNPTFVDDNKRIRPTSASNILTSRTYITTVGLYDANDNLLGVAKVNKPITKAPDNEVILRVRLDY
jgi:hypothetical protein